MTEQTLHPTEDELAAYHAGGLSEAEEDRLQEHLLGCRECTDLLLALDELHHPDEGEPVPAGELEAVWDGLQGTLAREQPLSPAPLPFARPTPPRAAPSSPRWLQALAASLALGVIGLSFWAVSLRRTVDELSQPQLNAPVADLLPGAMRGGEAGPAVVKLAPETRLFTVVLTPAGEGRYGDHEVEIVRTDGRVVWSGRGLRTNEFGSFSLTVPRRMVGEGEYEIRLFGIADTGREGVGTYRLRVE